MRKRKSERALRRSGIGREGSSKRGGLATRTKGVLMYGGMRWRHGRRHHDRICADSPGSGDVHVATIRAFGTRSIRLDHGAVDEDVLPAEVGVRLGAEKSDDATEVGRFPVLPER